MIARNLILPVLSALALWCPPLAAAQGEEHPEEHPKEHPEEQGAEHPEGAVEITKDLLGDAIEAFVNWDAELHGGYLHVYDPASGASLALRLEKVHRDRLADLGGGVYFACADFRASDGHMYDLDIFMEAAPGSPFHGLAPTEIAIHKQDGRARYTWHEESGIWKKRPVE